jgi:pimeloyl-ACP methyl ester carboxylesterase
MPTFTADDGTLLAYHLRGSGSPVVCLPGGPMQDSRYLGDLGGLTGRNLLVVLDLRGTGASEAPEDAGSYRCDRQVEDVEALRVDLGMDRMVLLGHSAGCNLVVRYAERHPDRVDRLVLVTPSPRALGVTVTMELRREIALLRSGEPWFPEAYAALERLFAGEDDADAEAAIAPFWHGRWDARARAQQAAIDEQRNDAAAAAFGSEGAFDPDATRQALSGFDRPVLVVAGEVDLNSPPPAVAEMARVFPRGRLTLQEGAGHYPWLDDADTFVGTTAGFLEAE